MWDHYRRPEQIMIIRLKAERMEVKKDVFIREHGWYRKLEKRSKKINLKLAH